MDDRTNGADLEAVIREVRERVRSRYPAGPVASGVELPDLMPIVHARDKAEGKVASIGTVNPRPPGLVNNALQAVKRLAARALDWHVREQVEFNRAAIECVQATLTAFNDMSRAVGRLAALVEQRHNELRRELDESLEPLRQRAESLEAEARELKDVRVHWAEWRKEWERKLSVNEIQFLRGVADLQTAFQHRATLMESNFRDTASGQHRDFTAALDRSRLDIQQQLWKDMESIRREYEALIHNELRVVRQRGLAAAPAAAVSTPGPEPEPSLTLDWLRFAERFRGTEEYVRAAQRRYLARFQGAEGPVLDIGCGRGEFLELAREAALPAYGIELSEELVNIARAKGLDARREDLFAHLAAAPAGSLGGVFCAQVVEHLPVERLPGMIRLCAEALRPGAPMVIETPNPSCLAIFATHFYLDPSHVRPVPASLLVFYLEESGFGRIEVQPVNDALESMPELGALPGDFRQAFFGGLDYAITAVRL